MSIDLSQNNQPKAQPKTTPEVAQMLGLRIEPLASQGAPTQFAPEGLPIVEADTSSAEDVVYIESAQPEAEVVRETPVETVPEVDAYPEAKGKSLIKIALPYLAIFVVGIFLYYFYFSTFSFTTVTKLFQQKASTVTEVIDSKTNKQSALDQLKAANLDAYNTYMRQFYFDTSDSSITDPDADNSKNGLTNFQKFLLGLNPKVYDSLGSGQADSQTLAAGIDPSTGEALGGKRKDLVDNYIDLEVANNKLTQNSLINPGQNGTSNQPVGGQTDSLSRVAGANIIGARNAGASTAGNLIPQTTPGPVSSTPASSVTAPGVQGANVFSAPATGASFSSGLSGQGLAINENVNATLRIPALKITVPIVWTKDTKNFERDLKSGVVHYPGTAMPGEMGTSYISGHSSNYAWVKGNYNRVFDTLDKLKVGDTFTITVTLKNGGKATLHYRVIKQQQYQPNDQAQLDNGSKSVVALSTCWPLGTTARRLVDFGELTQIEK